MANGNDDYAPKEAFDRLAANLEQPDKFAKVFVKLPKASRR